MGAWGVYTDNPAVVLLGVEYIRHDIAIQLMAEQFADHGIAEFWSNNEDMQRLRSDAGIPAAILREAEHAEGRGGANHSAGQRLGRKRSAQ